MSSGSDTGSDGVDLGGVDLSVLHARARGDLVSAEDLAMLEAQLEANPDCRAYFDALTEAHAAHAARDPEERRETLSALIDAAEQVESQPATPPHRPRRGGWTRWLPAAGLAAAATAAIWVSDWTPRGPDTPPPGLVIAQVKGGIRSTLAPSKAQTRRFAPDGTVELTVRLDATMPADSNPRLLAFMVRDGRLEAIPEAYLERSNADGWAALDLSLPVREGLGGAPGTYTLWFGSTLTEQVSNFIGEPAAKLEQAEHVAARRVDLEVVSP